MKPGPAKARYLLRFDDLCPTMDRGRWKRFRGLIERFGVRPILAVIPDNCDPELDHDPPYSGFWEEMRALETGGAAIGLHGYRHLCMRAGRSLIPMHGRTEFAGASLEMQRSWIEAGLGMLRERGLRPQVFVAPRHGLDQVTLRVLREVGIGLVSDGFARQPFRHLGLVWIPQQVWEPVEKESGLWTICLHSNSATDQDVAALEAFLARFSGQFTSVDRVLAEWTIGERSFGDRCFHGWMVLRIRLGRFRRRMGALGAWCLYPWRVGCGCSASRRE
jgi:predicted deacetylase